MHKAASDWVFERFHHWRGDRDRFNILEIGALNINGSVRDFLSPFSNEYVGIDPQDGPNVDVVASGHEYCHPGYFDVVVSCEVFEHTPLWQAIISNAWANLKEGGLFVATMAGEGRPPHSGVHGNAPFEWEHYANIGEWQLRQTLRMFKEFDTSYIGKDHHPDLRCWAVK
jgi:SAM-dependent methyltransferase